MSITLTEQQQQALVTQAEFPPRMIDPTTQKTYRLVPAELYEKMEALFDDVDLRGMDPLLADLAPEDWEDLANYENWSSCPSRARSGAE